MLISKKLDFIIEQNEQNKLSHAFLIETNNVDKCINDIKELIKIINCPNNYCDSCTIDCNICKLIDDNNLPSLITIFPDGMSIKKDQITELINKFSTKPIYSKYNSYIIVNAEVMNQVSSNILLKFLEEPSDFIIGFYITNNIKQILPTIKSRCEVINVIYNNDICINNEIIKLAEQYLYEINNGNDYLVNKKILANGLERKDIQQMFLFIFDKYREELKNCLQYNKDDSKVLKILELIKKELQYLQYNVNLELILDDFVIEMRRTHE